MLQEIERTFREGVPSVDFCSLRFVSESTEMISVRQDILQPVTQIEDRGAMITVLHKGGMGYAATSDLSATGFRKAFDEAQEWARISSGKSVVDFAKVPTSAPTGEYRTPVREAWDSVPLKEKINRLQEDCARLKTDPRIVDWMTSMTAVESESLYLTTGGGRVYQKILAIIPFVAATANEGTETQTRTLGGRGCCRLGGMEILEAFGYPSVIPTIATEALELLAAPNCPSGKMDLLLAPDQMILQIHESIGHPLELDRILGDERNYAGTSFVTPDMFDTYRYGSDLLNITFDPTKTEQLASYMFDDDGDRASKEYIIRNGILQRALGGVTSRARSGVPGVANSRACSWNRQPIDRMANLNLEPGSSTIDEMVSAVSKGVYMKTNRSWSIDDSRNKFQFGCEWGRLIENGKLTTVVKNPNYRGISATFWRNLKMTGNDSTADVLGTPNCGKGEPNQMIRVGHASPTCLFADVDVFGGV